jgi:hypothetical protein
LPLLAIDAAPATGVGRAPRLWDRLAAVSARQGGIIDRSADQAGASLLVPQAI